MCHVYVAILDSPLSSTAHRCIVMQCDPLQDEMFEAFCFNPFPYIWEPRGRTLPARDQAAPVESLPDRSDRSPHWGGENGYSTRSVPRWLVFFWLVAKYSKICKYSIFAFTCFRKLRRIHGTVSLCIPSAPSGWPRWSPKSACKVTSSSGSATGRRKRKWATSARSSRPMGSGGYLMGRHGLPSRP